MVRQHGFLGLVIMTSLFYPDAPANGEVYPLIVKGKVVMQDGSPPPKSVGIQRICTDMLGSAPGPITNRKGEYLWRMDVDPMRTRACRLEANLPGYVSTSVDISALNGYTDTAKELPPLVLSTRTPDPLSINNSDSDVPGRAASAWKAAMTAIDSGHLPDATRQLQAVVQAAPKFARGWQTLGIVYDTQLDLARAREAYEHAIEADPKLLASYVTLARVCIKAKDWQASANAADALIKVDSKNVYPEVYLHRAVARYGLKDLDGAKTSAEEALQEAVRPDQKKKAARAELVLGKVYAAKGDYAVAREHISKYLALDPNTPDIDLIKAYLQVVGKPEGAGVDPDLELP
jgi:cytochrome c-type biogenesis protein CcmH/NrfG